MNRSTSVLALLILSSLNVQSQSQSPQPSVNEQANPQQATPSPVSGDGKEAKIDPAKEANIRQLLEVTKSRELAIQVMLESETRVKNSFSNSLPPGEYREKLVSLFFTRLNSKIDSQHLTDLIVPIYDKYLTEDEIKGLIQFYESPLGQKAVSVLPKVVAESQQAGQMWGRELGRQTMLEVLAEHPDLEEALKAAGKKSKPE